MKKLSSSLVALFVSPSFAMSASLSGTYTSTQTISEDSYIASGSEYTINMKTGTGIKINQGCTLTVQDGGSLLINSNASNGAGIYVYGTFKVEEGADVKVPRFVIYQKNAKVDLDATLTKVDGSSFGVAVAASNTTLTSTVSQRISQWDVRGDNFTLGFAKDVVYTYDELSIWNVQSPTLKRDFNVNLTNFDDSNMIVFSLGTNGSGYDIQVDDTKLVIVGKMTQQYGNSSTPMVMGTGTVTYNFNCDKDITINEMFDGSGNLTGYTISTLQAVPEPAEWAILLGTLALGLAIYRRRK